MEANDTKQLTLNDLADNLWVRVAHNQETGRILYFSRKWSQNKGWSESWERIQTYSKHAAQRLGHGQAESIWTRGGTGQVATYRIYVMRLSDLPAFVNYGKHTDGQG